MNERKQHVIETAKELFANRGFKESSIQDIIDKCNISKGTFYNYFTSKNEFLISYMNFARAEEYKRRNALLQNNNLADKAIFKEQILVRIYVKNEFTLRPIYEIAFHSEDSVLRTFIESRFVEESAWLTERLIDIYGSKYTAYAADAAVIMHGMIQNMLYTWKTQTTTELDINQLVQFIIRRMDSIMKDLLRNNDTFLTPETCSFYIAESSPKQQLISAVRAFKQSLHKDNQSLIEHTEFLLEELQSDTPRIHLIRSFNDHFHVLTKDLPNTSDVKEIIVLLNQFLGE